MLRLHNTKTGREETFEARVSGKVAMYVCGPTVYDLTHVGHARSYVTFDVLRRYLECLGYRITHIQNFTDVDERITRRARAAGVEPSQLADRYIEEYFRDMDRLHVRRATVHPRTTGHIDDCIRITETLIKRGLAYASKGDVYVRNSAVKEAGGVIHRLLDDALACTPEPVNRRKKDPMDFAIWKRVTTSEPSWHSPWGPGRPGWHTECAAMALKYAGPTLDLHGGGMDLIYPHHDSEAVIAEAATGQEFCRYYLHNGFVTSHEVKMSKSRGNFVTTRALLEKWEPDSIRWFLLSTQYRKRMEFHEKWLAESNQRLARVRQALKRFFDLKSGPPDAGTCEAILRCEERFMLALQSDFDTPMALATLSEMALEMRSLAAVDTAFRDAMAEHLATVEEILGVSLLPADVSVPRSSDGRLKSMPSTG